MKIILLIIILLAIIIALFTYLIIVGGSMSKTAEEQKMEDLFVRVQEFEEQMKYLQNYKKRRKKRWKEIFIKAIFIIQN